MRNLFVTSYTFGVAAAILDPTNWPNIDLNQFVEKTFDNKIDHFNYLDNRTFKQRYWLSD